MDLLAHTTTYRPPTPLSCLKESEKAARRAAGWPDLALWEDILDGDMGRQLTA